MKKNEKIITWDAVAKYHGISAELPDNSAYPEHMRGYMNACYQLPLIIDAANGKDEKGEQWEPDYTNTSQPKWELWLTVKATKAKKSGVGLSLYDCDYGYSLTVVGSRFAFRERSIAIETFENFKSVFEAKMLK